jgi:hypoxanthine phosphoribosyltransferase
MAPPLGEGWDGGLPVDPGAGSMGVPEGARGFVSHRARSAGLAGVEKLFSKEEIHRRVAKIARQINRDYKGRTLHLVVVLESSFIFVADLVRALQVDVVCHMLTAKMRNSSIAGLPLREIVYSPPLQLSGQDVLLIDGILETGVTLDYLYNSIAMQRPRTLRTAALLEKISRKKVGLAAEYLGFTAQKGYLVGYGLGRGGKYQNLPYIASVSPPRRTREPRAASNKR